MTAARPQEQTHRPKAQPAPARQPAQPTVGSNETRRNRVKKRKKERADHEKEKGRKEDENAYGYACRFTKKETGPPPAFANPRPRSLHQSRPPSSKTTHVRLDGVSARWRRQSRFLAAPATAASGGRTRPRSRPRPRATATTVVPAGENGGKKNGEDDGGNQSRMAEPNARTTHLPREKARADARSLSAACALRWRPARPSASQIASASFSDVQSRLVSRANSQFTPHAPVAVVAVAVAARAAAPTALRPPRAPRARARARARHGRASADRARRERACANRRGGRSRSV